MQQLTAPDLVTTDKKNTKSRSSLKHKLLLPYVLLILLLTLVLGWLSWWSNASLVSDLGNQLMTETTQRISQAIDRHMYGSGAVLETAFPTGISVKDDISSQQEDLTLRFYTAASLFSSSTDYVHFGNELGQGLGVQRLPNSSIELRLKIDTDKPRDYYFQQSINSTPEFKRSEEAVFDPRTRPWYQMGRNASGDIWTAVYLDYDSNELVVTRARKVMNQENKFSGVVATDLFLSDLNTFLYQLPITENGRAFIVEPDGQLISASNVTIVTTNLAGEPIRVNALDSGDETIAQAWQKTTQLMSSHQIDDGKVHLFEFNDLDNKKVFASVQYVVDNAGLNWYAILVVPSKDILTSVRNNSLTVIVIGMLAVLIAILFGWVVFGRVTRDIGKLSAAVKNTGRDLTDISEQAKRTDEIGVLARSFSQMRHKLFTDRLTNVGNRMALEYGLDTLLIERKNKQQPFALFFLDLNKFKQLNDTYGHDVGDLALIESAQRIASLLPAGSLLTRLGGDEFVVVLKQTENLEQLRQQLQDGVAQPLDCCEGFSLGVAIGIAVYPEDALNRNSLLRYADEQMYEAKKASRAGR